LCYTIDAPFSALKISFNTDFRMDSGINVLGIITTLSGASALVFASFLASSPVGWTAATVLGAIGLVFNFYKAVRSFFSSDYKKRQQRKAADDNLEAVFTKLSEMLDGNLESASAKIQEVLQVTKRQLGISYEQCINTKVALEEISANMLALHDKLVCKQTSDASEITAEAA